MDVMLIMLIYLIFILLSTHCLGLQQICWHVIKNAGP